MPSAKLRTQRKQQRSDGFCTSCRNRRASCSMSDHREPACFVAALLAFTISNRASAMARPFSTSILSSTLASLPRLWRRNSETLYSSCAKPYSASISDTILESLGDESNADAGKAATSEERRLKGDFKRGESVKNSMNSLKLTTPSPSVSIFDTSF